MKCSALRLMAALPLLACDPATEAPVDLAAAALTYTASGEQFVVSGAIRIATCDGSGALAHRAINAPTQGFELRASAATCSGLTGEDQDSCEAAVAPIEATVQVDSGGNAALNTTYAAAPLRIISDGTNDIPLSYEVNYSGSGTTGPLVHYQNSTRYLYQALPRWPLTAPAAAGEVVDRPFVYENLASYRVRIEYTPRLRNALDQLDPNDRINSISFSVTLSSSGRRVVHRFQYACSGGTCANDPASVDADSAAGLNRFLNIPAVDGVSPQIIIAELPVTPNTVGAFTGDSYQFGISAVFADGVRTVIPSAPFGPTSVAPCAEVDKTVVLTRPLSEVNGSIVLRRDPAHLAESPYVTHYAPTLRQIDPDSNIFFPVTIGGDPIVVATSTPDTPYTFRWLGAPQDDYWLEGANNSSSARPYLRPHAQLAYPGSPLITYTPVGAAYRPIFRFPMSGSSTPSGMFQVLAGDLDLDGEADAPVTLTIAGDMAYLQGSLALVGCLDPGEAAAGIAEISGGLARGSTTLTRGFSRGAFRPASADYLIAAIDGAWVEGRYAFQFSQPDYTGFMVILPADPQSYTLTTGWDNTTTAPERIYSTGQLTLTISAKDGSGDLLDSRNPRLEIHREGELGEFRDPVTTELLGSYYSVSERIDNAVHQTHTLDLIGLSSSTPVLVVPSLEVQLPNGTWSRTTLTTLEVPLGGSIAEGCEAICVDTTVEPPVSYTDDGLPPVISAPPSIALSANATTATVTVTATDYLELTDITANGVAMTPGPGVDQYTATVPVSAATTSIDIATHDQCRNLTTASIAVTFAPDLCADPGFDMCMEGGLGSVFYVAVIRDSDDAICQARCDASAGAINCDPTPVCPN